MERLALKLLRLILIGSGLPSSCFDNIMDKHTSILSLNCYEPVDMLAAPTIEPQVRVEIHTDVSLLTIVAQCAEQGTAAGVLQVFIPGDDNGGGEFITVPYVPGSLVVNIGDCLHDWSQGLFPSALHRVVNLPPTVEERETLKKDGSDGSRYSFAYFCSPNYDARMDWPPGGASASSTSASTGGLSPTLCTKPVTDYSTWRKQHIEKSMQQLKKSTQKAV